MCWKIRLAFIELCRRRFASGRTVEILPSHYTTRCFMRLELLCVFNAAYAFAEQAGDRAVKIWPSVLRELNLASHLIALAYRDLGAEWDPEVIVVDASSWGLGGCSYWMSDPDIAPLGSFNERWRFTQSGEKSFNPRDSVLLAQRLG
eukprot:2444978-Pyramimonas_sp.AAC.1